MTVSQILCPKPAPACSPPVVKVQSGMKYVIHICMLFAWFYVEVWACGQRVKLPTSKHNFLLLHFFRIVQNIMSRSVYLFSPFRCTEQFETTRELHLGSGNHHIASMTKANKFIDYEVATVKTSYLGHFEFRPGNRLSKLRCLVFRSLAINCGTVT